MALFRKKPVVISAHHWHGGEREADLPQWIVRATKAGGGVRIDQNSGTLHIDTLEGTMTASPGDWIIQGVNDELYPCKPDIFQKTYEPVP